MSDVLRFKLYLSISVDTELIHEPLEEICVFVLQISTDSDACANCVNVSSVVQKCRL